MIEAKRCPECGVPELLSQQQVWLNNGDIVQRANPHARVSFIECENLDPLFRMIGDIIGISIERIIVNISSRAHEAYMRKLIPQEIKDLIAEGKIDADVFREPIIERCHISGFGKYEYIGRRLERDEGDYYRQRITRPYSVPIAAGALAGALSAVVGGEHKVDYVKVGPDCYEFTTSWTEYPEELMERFEMARYEHREGDLELECCPECGLPKALEAYRWDLENGLILNRYTGRRMAILGPESLEQCFLELEYELGEKITDVIVEAQRRFTRTGFYSIKQVSDEGDFRAQLALRGLGNLREMEMNAEELLLLIDNATASVMTVGMVQGLFEMAFDVESKVEWAVSDEGNLEVEVNPLR